MISKSAVGPLGALMAWPITLLHRVLFVAAALALFFTSTTGSSVLWAQKAHPKLDVRKAADSVNQDSGSPSLEQLIDRATRIVRGEISQLKRDTGSLSIRGVNTEVRVWSALFDKAEFLKPIPSSFVENHVIRLKAANSKNVAVGNSVIWFLYDVPGTDIARMVDDNVGSFLVWHDEREDSPEFMVAENANLDRGLWKERLWSREQREEARSFIQKLPGMNETRLQKVMSVAALPCAGRPVPLELILAAVHVQLSPRSGNSARR